MFSIPYAYILHMNIRNIRVGYVNMQRATYTNSGIQKKKLLVFLFFFFFKWERVVVYTQNLIN